MSENETYGVRLEKKIDNMHQQLADLNSAFIRSEARNETNQSQSSQNRRDIEMLQRDMNQAKGGLNFAKMIAGTALLSVIGFGTWTAQSISSAQQRMSDISLQLQQAVANSNSRIGINESKLVRLDTDVSIISKRKDSHE